MILPATPFNTKMHFYLSLHNKKDQFSGSWPCTSNEIQNNPWQKEPFWLNQMRLLKSHVLRDHFVALSFCLKYSPGENLPPLAPRHPLYMSHLSSRLSARRAARRAWPLSEAHLGNTAELPHVRHSHLLTVNRPSPCVTRRAWRTLAAWSAESLWHI